jgi:hypothetical protein
MINKQQKQALLLEIHKSIEDAVLEAIKIYSGESSIISYPPNGGLTTAELKALRKTTFSSESIHALRKIIADAASNPIFKLLSLLDGVADPENFDQFWPGFDLVPKSDEEPDEESLLHDDLFDTYWEWRKIRLDPGWRLDNFE